MWEQSSLSGSSFSSPKVMTRRRLVSREPRPEIADEDAKDEKYELILSVVERCVVLQDGSLNPGWRLELQARLVGPNAKHDGLEIIIS